MQAFGVSTKGLSKVSRHICHRSDRTCLLEAVCRDSTYAVELVPFAEDGDRRELPRRVVFLGVGAHLVSRSRRLPLASGSPLH